MGILSNIKHKIMRKTNKNNKTRKIRGKSFEEIMKNLKEVREMFDNNKVKEIESARKRGTTVYKKKLGSFSPKDILLKERNINDIFKEKYKFSEQRQLRHISFEDSQLDDAQFQYMIRHKDLYPHITGEKITIHVKNNQTRKSR
jgi:hypothetical protein